MLKLGKHTSDEVMKQFRILIKKYKTKFRHIFKSITFDNGSEFYRVNELLQYGTEVYFTHPNSPFEKGSVENLNVRKLKTNHKTKNYSNK